MWSCVLRRGCVPSCVLSYLESAFVCSFRGLFACVLSWVEIYGRMPGELPGELPGWLPC